MLVKDETVKDKNAMNLPTEQQCFELYEKYKVPQSIRDHCLNVRKVAVFLAEKINEAGENVNLEFVNALALLHDLFKMVSIKSLEPTKFHSHKFSADEIKMRKFLRKKYPYLHEGEVAFIIFKDEYPQLALSLRDMSKLDTKNGSLEEQLVLYADGRVLKDNIVTLQERVDYLKETYPLKIDLIKETWLVLTSFEEKIAQLIKIQPEQLAQRVEMERKS